jgi:hypothetical protein
MQVNKETMSRFRQRSGVRCWAVFGLWAAVGLVPGCGREQQQPAKLVPVAGKVTVDDRALTEGSVLFWPDPAKGNHGKYPSTAAVSREGTYTLYTEGQKGVAPGWYKVVVFPFPLGYSALDKAPKRTPEELPNSPVPAPYMDLDTTPLSLEVTESPAEEAYRLNLKR